MSTKINLFNNEIKLACSLEIPNVYMPRIYTYTVVFYLIHREEYLKKKKKTIIQNNWNSSSFLLEPINHNNPWSRMFTK